MTTGLQSLVDERPVAGHGRLRRLRCCEGLYASPSVGPNSTPAAQHEDFTKERWRDVNVIEPSHVGLGIDAVKMDWLHGTSRRKDDLPAEPSPIRILNLSGGSDSKPL